MKASKLFFPTFKENPVDAETVSASLMIRGGLIKKLASGFYEWLPLGFKVMKKIEEIIREEMNKIGAQEILLPILTPRNLWEETKRWEKYGDELFKLKDRRSADFCLAPTHEEVITDLVRSVVKSYKQLPLILYQFGLKYRDEMRPRFGIIRAKEFYMKDAYSFHSSDADAEECYKMVCTAYSKIFDRFGFDFKIVEASSGIIGGKFSHEFMVLASSGEDEVVVCSNCGYASNLDRADYLIDNVEAEEMKDLEEVYTPGMRSVDEVSNFLGEEATKFIKTLIYEGKNGPFGLLIRGDREVNEPKLIAEFGDGVKMADQTKIEAVTGAPVGYAGPVGLKKLDLFADISVKGMVNAISGANKKDYHLKNINFERDFNVKKFVEISRVKHGDKCRKCSHPLNFHHGIEIAHTFKLGDIYSRLMNATFLDSDGKRKFYIMGCYGIGVSRIVAAIIEQNHDNDGIIWPKEVAPYDAYILPINWEEKIVREKSEQIYQILSSNGFDVLLDDRTKTPGTKFKDCDLIGLPLRIVVSKKSLMNDEVEFRLRREKESFNVKIENILEEVKRWIR